MSNDEIEDIILDRIISGDNKACRYIIDAYKTRVYNLAYQIVNNREDAQEIAQDSFMKAFQSLKKFNRQAKFSTWLYRITYNAALTKTRRGKVIKNTVGQLQDNELPFGELNADSQLYTQERQHYIQAALSQLKEDDRTLVALYYMQENSMEEIAEITGLSLSNVKVKIHRSRQKLQEILSHILVRETKTLY